MRIKISCWITSICYSLIPEWRQEGRLMSGRQRWRRGHVFPVNSSEQLIFSNFHSPLSPFRSIFIHTSPLMPCLLIIGIPQRWWDNPSSAQLVFHVRGRLTRFSLLTTDNCISLPVNSFWSLRWLSPLFFIWRLAFMFFTIMKPVNSTWDATNAFKPCLDAKDFQRKKAATNCLRCTTTTTKTQTNKNKALLRRTMRCICTLQLWQKLEKIFHFQLF